MTTDSPKTVLVTGAAKRLGRAIALKLAGAGWSVAVHCRESRAEAAEVANAVTALGVKSVVVEADLAREDEKIGRAHV